MQEFLEEVKDNWNNAYWWADHQWLMAIGMGVILGGISFTFKYGELKMEQRMKGVE